MLTKVIKKALSFFSCVFKSNPVSVRAEVRSSIYFLDFLLTRCPCTLPLFFFFLGAFLIPYFISLVLLGIPLFFLELAIGQSVRQGPISVWKAIHPYLGGVGLASVVVCLLISMYYNMIIGWCFYYLFVSFQDPLPYSSCPLGPNCTVNEGCNLAGRTQYYWYTKALGAATSIEDIGDFQWHLCLVLLLSWIVLYLFVSRGVKSAGKVKSRLL